MKVLKIIGNVVLWLFIAFAALMTILALTSQNNVGVPSIFGKMPTTILTQSMQKPADATGDTFTLDDGTVVEYACINQGDWIFNTHLPTGEEKAALKVGDIITFWADINEDGEANELKTHRIIKIEESDGYFVFSTKGDNNAISDAETVQSYDVVGVYDGVKLPGVGAAIGFLQQPIGFLCCIVLPLILFFLYELYRFIVVIVSRKKKELTPEEEDEIKKKAVAEYLAQQQAASEAPEATGSSEISKPETVNTAEE